MSSRARRGEDGSAVAEFCLVMVVLVPLVLGVMQVGFVLHVRNTLTAAASDGARVASRSGATPEDGARRTREQITRALSSRYARDVTTRRTSSAGQPVVLVRARAEVPALGVIGPAVTVTGTGRAVAEPG
ncbi:TadE/TadG family type IV pilus assembly protein [Mumia quercus]|uniref:TadE/TadG family type IV pilus assembly protein n=1 Tax=Mumia quercus TaxID=2976125 RepID=UPI0021CE3729|nr:TadE/TadG family type IV pilus assembly protein [Mumia quercus]